MTTEEFDVIVVGAGAAGLCCAGELVQLGRRPLVVCETAEVASMYRSKFVDGNRGILQHLQWDKTWGGGWWYPLARSLNIPAKMYKGLPFELIRPGQDTPVRVPSCIAASGFIDILNGLSPEPIPEAMRGEIERILQLGLEMPYEQLLRMDRVPLMEWLTEQGADELVALAIFGFCNFAYLLGPEEAPFLSMFAGFASIRLYFCGESDNMVVFPDAREGVWVPMAKAIEQCGGEVWRGQKVDRVLVEGDRAVGVALADGREVRAPKVALACSNKRIAEVLQPLPPEVAEAIDFTKRFIGLSEDFLMYTVLERPVIKSQAILSLMHPDGRNLHSAIPLHGVAPWSVAPGKHFLASLRHNEIADGGTAEQICAEMHEYNEMLNPGYTDAVGAVAVQRRPTISWIAPCSYGPKLPRTTEDLPGLFFANDGTGPVSGLFTEASAGSGVLAARAMAAVSR